MPSQNLSQALQLISDSLKNTQARVDVASSVGGDLPTMLTVLKIIEGLLNNNLLKGERGDPGRDARTPVRGLDYYTMEEINQIKQAVTPLKGKEYFTPEEIAQFLKDITPIKGIHYADGLQGPPGANGLDGLDATVDPEDVQQEVEAGLVVHTKTYDHTLLHDPKMLGSLELDIEKLKDGQIFQRKGKKIVGIDLPKLIQQKYFGNNSPVNPKLVSRVTTSDTTLAQEDGLLLVDASGGAVTVTLPNANAFDRWQFYIKKTDSSDNFVTISGTLDGESGRVLAVQNQVYHIVSANDSWYII